ncbi:MAG: hypothetical protein GF398_07580 [Chitinivibrionales bacterium]|nr:hypothetical protein [Chitinivibrionales bacterium]
MKSAITQLTRQIWMAFLGAAFFACIEAQPPAAENAIQNAVLEGIQLSAEKGETEDEKLVTCYFIFRDKPTSYFYDLKRKENKLIFEFNDTEMGSSPIPSQSEAPISGFEIEKKRVDYNKDIKGLMPEWHDVVIVTFDVEAIPTITVNDQYNIITFSYKWTTDQAKVELYAQKEKRNLVLPISLGAVGVAGVATLIVYLVQPEEGPPALGDIPVDDLPKHEFPK